MKRQCTDPQQHPNPTTSSAAAMFSDNHLFIHPKQPYPSSSPLQHPNNSIVALPDSNHDGASIETQRRPRGRPPGSKNKPKSPNPNPARVIQPGPNPTNQHHILEILNGADVIDSIAKYSLRHNTSLRILHASGAVANATIRQPNHHSAFTFPGRFDILSLSAVFVTPSIRSQIPVGALNDVAIALSIPKGHVVGGFAMGPLMASGSVFVLVESISSLTYHRLDLDEDGVERARENANTTSSGCGQSPSGGEKNGAGGGGGECGFNVPMYSASFMPY